MSANNAEAFLRGDVNCDKTVDVTDAVQLARMIAEDPEVLISAQGKRNADCDADGKLTSDDVITLLQYIAKLIPAL